MFLKKIRIAAVAMFALLMVATPLASAQDSESMYYPEPQRTISTTGTGIVTVEPDMARFSVGLEARGEDLKPAQDEVTKEANDITAMLLENGVEEKDIVTTSYRVDTEEKRDRNGNFVEITGYRVTMSISITVNDIDLVGTLLDESVTLGADYVSSISFSVADPDPHIREARQLAIADAKLKAEDYAIGSDSSLTGLFSLYESSSPQPTARDAGSAETMDAPVMAEDVEMSASEPVQISAGSTTFVVRVETTWTIQPNGDVIQPESTPTN